MAEAERHRQRRWKAPDPDDARRIQEHLDRQRGLPRDRVRLSDGRVVRVGEDAEGEGDNE